MSTKHCPFSNIVIIFGLMHSIGYIHLYALAVESIVYICAYIDWLANTGLPINIHSLTHIQYPHTWNVHMDSTIDVGERSTYAVC